MSGRVLDIRRGGCYEEGLYCADVMEGEGYAFLGELDAPARVENDDNIVHLWCISRF